MVIKIFLALILIMSVTAQAQKRTEFKTLHKGKKMDLLQEGSTLSLNQEASVQEYNPPSKMFATILAGGMEPTSLTITSSGHTMNYNFDRLLPIATVQFNHYPWQKNGKWGWSASLGYSYSQYEDTVATALHIVPLDLNVAYRMELKDSQKVIPYIMAGPSVLTYFQRGPDAYNTSESVVLASATAGLSFNLNRLHLLTSRNDTEIVLQYKRTIDPSGTDTNFGGNSVQIGGTIAL